MPTPRKFLTPLVTALLFGAGILAPATAAHAVGTSSAARPTAVTAAAGATVAQAIAGQGSSGTVTGYVVGQPTGSSTVVRSNFPSDYALALADSAGETASAKILYVQIPSAFRAGYGLKTNPTLVGKQLDVTGSFASYFSHPGLTSATAFAGSDGGGGGTDPGDPGDGGGTTDPGAYYSGTSGLSGAALRSKLHTIISTNVTTLSYAEVWDGIKDVDQDPNNPNNVVELYTGRSVSKSSNGSGVENWNREHVYAKSHGDFGTANGPGTDLNHLRAADVSVNSSRGKKDFAEGGTENSEAKGNYSTATSWEPRDADKGDVARMIFYMDIRWEGGDGKPNLGVNEILGNGSAPYMGKLSDLKKWNAQDPPDAFEKTRNQKVFDNWQHNRNPFIDHPEWVAAIYGS